jgi:hypothetical protein
VGRVAIDKGVGRLQGVQAKSPDVEVYLEGEIKLNQPLSSSSVDLYLRFKLSDALLKSSEKLRTIMQFAGSAGKRPDGFYGVRLSGPVQHLGTPVWTKTSPFGAPASGPKPIAAKAGAGFTPPPPAPEPVAAPSSAPAAPPAAPGRPPGVDPAVYDPKIDNPPPEEQEPPPPPPPPTPAPTPPPPPAAAPPPPPTPPAPGPAPPASSDPSSAPKPPTDA